MIGGGGMAGEIGGEKGTEGGRKGEGRRKDLW